MVSLRARGGHADRRSAPPPAESSYSDSGDEAAARPPAHAVRFDDTEVGRRLRAGQDPYAKAADPYEKHSSSRPPGFNQAPGPPGAGADPYDRPPPGPPGYPPPADDRSRGYYDSQYRAAAPAGAGYLAPSYPGAPPGSYAPSSAPPSSAYGAPPPSAYYSSAPPPGYGYPSAGYPPPGYGQPPPGYGPAGYPGYGAPPLQDGRGYGSSPYDRRDARSSRGSTDAGRGSTDGGRNNRGRKRKKSPSPGRPNLTMDQVMRNVVESAKDAAGSAFLVQRLQTGISDSDRELVTEKCLSNALSLSMHEQGSAVIRKLLDRMTSEQRLDFVGRLKGEVYDLSNDKSGCWVVQKILEVMDTPTKADFMSELHGKVLDCIDNMHGNHVIQAACRNLPSHELQFIVEALETQAAQMASHIYGCRVLQRLLEACPAEQVDRILDKLVGQIAELSRDKAGNYVVQCVLERGRLDDRLAIMMTIRENVLEFSKNKVSSNVVERCLEVAGRYGRGGAEDPEMEEESRTFFDTMLGEADDDKSPVRVLMEDKFGNYTVQSLIRYCRGDILGDLETRIRAGESKLQGTAGKNILDALEKRLSQGPDAGPKDLPEGIPSVGSLEHEKGNCKPCAWFWKPSSCQNGKNCQHCHLCPEGELKERKKAKRGGGKRKEKDS
eukprot:TRINITY_DN100940_c0_g1_i1.p1 TRINITY_DN100940_c0_g1~~TRINITY_DN100940_c0_g1_i1.p1  ORF type:complete len:663 (-),score=131.56 TRINITY_DN100940_c0_g1_i1:208-2196(-)